MSARLDDVHIALRCGGQVVALPLAAVALVCRRLPLTPVAARRDGVLGMSRIRGGECPVLDLAWLLTGAAFGAAERLVVLRCGEGRRVALAVEALLGVVRLPAERRAALPPLVAADAPEGLRDLARVDRELYQVLDEARLVPEELAAGEANGGSER